VRGPPRRSRGVDTRKAIGSDEPGNADAGRCHLAREKRRA
jgi:hypothetical protein